MLTLRLVEALAGTPAGSSVHVTVDDPADVEVARRWSEATGNTVLAVHPDSVEIVRGRIADPIEALAPESRPGHRLWIYTNFHCNLACDYCCVESSPRARPRVIGVEELSALVDEAVHAGVAELFLTGGEPFMLLDLDERLRIAAGALPTTVLTNATVFSGERRRRLERLPREGLTLQVSLDSAAAPLHDRHRGEGTFALALQGISTLLDLGFRVRVAATLGADAGSAEADLAELCDQLGLGPDQRVVRRVARQGLANTGLVVSRRSLVPEVCVTAEGVWWHPVAAVDPAMKVRDGWRPLAGVIGAVREEYRGYRVSGDLLASTFPCA
jgi:pyruvate-formate lyase-activating enzyme